MPTLKEEAIIVRRYATRYDGFFFRTMGGLLELADNEQTSAIKNAFPEWWSRCIRNTRLLEQRGIPVGDLE